MYIYNIYIYILKSIYSKTCEPFDCKKLDCRNAPKCLNLTIKHVAPNIPSMEYF